MREIDDTGLDVARRRCLGAAAVFPWALGGVLPARAQGSGSRVALVIGNAAYAAAPLVNPVHDAQAMVVLLGGMGFEVIGERDADRARMEAAIDRAAAALHGRQGTGLLYYAGHGVQLDWRNYLLPVDARPANAAELPRQAVDVQRVIDAFRGAGTRTNVVVLDACRDNPFGASGARGLAPMDAPPGTFFAYATAPGNVADDGSAAEGNGLYTRFLLQELRKPDARIEDVFKRVRLQVRQATQGRQVPWESTSLEEDVVFSSGERVAAPSIAQREREFEAQRAEWERLRGTARADDLFAFLQRHPGGPFSEIAQFALDRLARPVVVAQAPAALEGVKMLPSGEPRFVVGDQWEALVTDHRAGGAQRRVGSRVTAIEGGRVLINGGQVVVDQTGMTLLNGFGRKDPGVLVVPAELAVGKRWRSVFTNSGKGGVSRQNYYDHHIAALEEVTVPAGRFRAFRIEQRGQSIGPNDHTLLIQSLWIDPASMWTVRWTTRHEVMHKGWVTFDESGVTTAMRRRPR